MAIIITLRIDGAKESDLGEWYLTDLIHNCGFNGGLLYSEAGEVFIDVNDGLEAERNIVIANNLLTQIGYSLRFVCIKSEKD